MHVSCCMFVLLRSSLNPQLLPWHVCRHVSGTFSGFRKRGLANGVSPFFFFLKMKRTKKGRKQKKRKKTRKKTERNGKKEENGKNGKNRKRHRSGDPHQTCVAKPPQKPEVEPPQKNHRRAKKSPRGDFLTRGSFLARLMPWDPPE